MSSDNTMGADRSVRLLRAKAHELENMMLMNAVVSPFDLLADLALLYTLVAEHIERVELM